MSDGRRGLSPKDRQYVFVRDGYRCVDCRQVFHPDDLQVDHDQEVVDNGPHHPGNYVTRCAPRDGGGCHRAKTSRNATARARANRSPVTTAASSRRRTPAAPEPQSPYRWVTLPLAGSPLAWGAGQVLAEPTLGTAGGAGLVALAVFGSGAQAVHRKRRAVEDRLSKMVAADVHGTPGTRLVRVRSWRALSPQRLDVAHGHLFDPTDRAAVDQVVGLLARKTGVDLVLDTVDEPRDLIRVCARDLAGARDDEPVEGEERARDTGARARITEAVTGYVRLEPVTVKWAGNDDAIGPREFAVTYPATFRDDNDEIRLGLLNRVNEKAPGRWRAQWDGEANRVTFLRRPPVRASEPRPARPKDMPWYLLRLGIDEDGQETCANLRVTPHLLVVGSTGGGKTVTITGLVTDWLAQGLDAILVDGKGPALSGYRHRKGVIAGGYGEPEDMAEAMEKAEWIVRDRYRKVMDEGAEPEDFPPLLVVLDEAAEFAVNVEKWWKGLPKPERGEPARPRVAPALDSWSSVARIGRECQVHLIVGLQQAAAGFFGASEARDNFSGRLGMGPLSQIGAGMAFERSDVGRDLPSDVKGRATWMPGLSSDPVEVQSYWTPRPKPSGDYKPEDAEHLTALLGPPVAGGSRRRPVDPQPVPAGEQQSLREVVEEGLAPTLDGEDYARLAQDPDVAPEPPDLSRQRVEPDPRADRILVGDHIEEGGVRVEVVAVDSDPHNDDRVEIEYRPVGGGRPAVMSMDCSEPVPCWR